MVTFCAPRLQLASSHQRCINGLRLGNHRHFGTALPPWSRSSKPFGLSHQVIFSQNQEVITGLTRSPWLHLHPAIRPQSCSRSAALLQRDIFQERWTHHSPPSSKGSGSDTPGYQRTTPSTIWDLWRRPPPAMAMMTTFVLNTPSRAGTAIILAAHCYSTSLPSFCLPCTARLLSSGSPTLIGPLSLPRTFSRISVSSLRY